MKLQKLLGVPYFYNHYPINLVMNDIKQSLPIIKWYVFFICSYLFFAYEVSFYSKFLRALEINTELLKQHKQQELTFAEVTENWQMMFSPAANANAEATQIFHSDLWVILGAIFILVSYVIYHTVKCFHYLLKDVRTKKERDDKIIELIWTLLPVCLVLIVVIPSFALSVSGDLPIDLIMLPEINIEINGHQWFWDYKINVDQVAQLSGVEQDVLDNYGGMFKEDIEFESFMTATVDLDMGDPRNLKVSTPLLVPEGFRLKMTTSGKDVIHSWSVPQLLAKVDSVPGRINQYTIDVPISGTYYGQCSEICGVNHGFMPIEVRVVPYEQFCEWVKNILDNKAKTSGIQGLKAYYFGFHGLNNNLFIDNSNLSLQAKAHLEMIRNQAMILHRHRLISEFTEWLGLGSIKDGIDHLVITSEFEFVNEKGEFAWVDQLTYSNWSHEKYIKTFPKRHPWLTPKYNHDEWRRAGCHTKPSWWVPYNRIAQPQLWHELRLGSNLLEPNYPHEDYLIKMPNSMMFETTRRMMFGMNNPMTNHIDWWRWRWTRVWIGEFEYNVLHEFPKPWGPNKELVVPVFREAYWEHDQLHTPRLCWRFLTQRTPSEILWKHSYQPMNMTIFMQGFDGTLTDSGVPIGNLWYTDMKYTTMPPLKILECRQFDKGAGLRLY